VQSDLADALDKAVGVLDEHRRKGETPWEGDMLVKVDLGLRLSRRGIS
jgi:hypothetical protein